MTADPEPRTRIAGRLSVAVAALAVAVIGIDVAGPASAVGVAGALAFAWGVDALAAEGYPRQAGGSIAAVLGGLAMLGAPLADLRITSLLTVSLGVVALAVLAIASTGGISSGRFDPVRTALRRSLGTVLLALAIAFFFAGFEQFTGAALLDVIVGTWLLLGRFAAFVSSRPLLTLAVLQIGSLVLVRLLEAARRVVDRWFLWEVPVASWGLLDALTLSYRRLPPAYWASLPFQLLLGVLDWSNAVVEWLLSSLWLFGTALELLLTSGVLLAGIALVALLPLAVLTAEVARRIAVGTLGPVPARRAALSAGGGSVAVLAWVGTWAGTAMGLLPSTGVGIATPTLLALIGGVLGVGALYVLVVATGFVVGDPVLRWPSGVVLGSGLLLLATFVGAAADATPLLVFVGVAATLAAWDLGSTAADVGHHLGRDAETRRAELVHATGTVGVGVVGIALASAAVYLLGPLAVAGERAGAAVLLVLVALVAVAILLALDAADL